MQMADQKKVLILYWGRLGGGPLVTLLLTRRLINGGHGRSVILSLSDQNELIDEFRALPVTLETGETFAGAPSTGGLLRRSLSFVARLRREIDRHRPATILVPMLFGATMPLLPWLRSSGAQFVYVVHDINQHPGERTGLEQAVAQFGLIRLADKLVTVSESMKNEFARKYPRLAARLVVEPLAGLYDSAAAAREFPAGRAMRFLVAGRLVRYKGYERLAQALRLMEHARCEVTFAGEGPERSRVAEQFGKLPNVTLRLQWTPAAVHRELFRDHDALLCPYDEASQSAVICDALSCAMPSIVTPVGALAEQIGFGKAGRVVPDMSPAALAETMARVSHDAAGYRAASAGCRDVLDTARAASGWPRTLGLA